MNDAPQGYEGGGSNPRRNDNDPPATEMRLRQALRTLRGIQQRCKLDYAGRPDLCSLSVNVALARADMYWIGAAIEAVEKAIAPGAIDAARPHTEASHEKGTWGDDVPVGNSAAQDKSVARR